MTRQRLIPDDVVLNAVLAILLNAGEKSVTFAEVARVSGLAPPTLVQRYGSCTAMITFALTNAWDQLDAKTAAATSDSLAAGKGLQGLLKALGGAGNTPALLAASLRQPQLAARAKTWRDGVEAALAARLTGSPKARETAALVFAAWQGRMLWESAGGKGFRLGEAVKRIG